MWKVEGGGEDWLVITVRGDDGGSVVRRQE